MEFAAASPLRQRKLTGFGKLIAPFKIICGTQGEGQDGASSKFEFRAEMLT
jgi:hypothetical protein